MTCAKTLKKKLEVFLPVYTYFPLAAVICTNMLAYFATRPFTQGWAHYDLSLPVDGVLPFVPAFSVIYLLAYIQWIVGYILIARESRALCYRVLSGEIIAKLTCMVLFLALPTAMIRPEITSHDVFSKITGYIYQFDAADNLFPSIHCLESWICFRGALRIKKVGRWYRWVTLGFTLLVFASVVLIKQHLVVDIIAGVAVCELGQLLAQKTDSARIFRRIEACFRKKETDLERFHEEIC